VSKEDPHSVEATWLRMEAYSCRTDSVMDVGGTGGTGSWGGCSCCVGGDEITSEEALERLLSSEPTGELGGGLLPSVWTMGGL
jgi:hypothetical protein